MKIVIRKLEELRGVLFDSRSRGPEEVYRVYRGIGQRDNKVISVTVMPPGKIGREFVKTYGHYHQGPGEETYFILYGEATFLLQKQSGRGKIEEVRLVEARAGQECLIPEGFGHCLINTGEKAVVAADWESPKIGHVYKEIAERKGMAYFLLEKEGKVEAVPNPNYGPLPPLKK